MKTYVPHYYKKFTCIASSCKDNCCMGGWEIEIDQETAARYQKIQNSFGGRLRSAIDMEDTPHFRLAGKKCPFLNHENLCEIFISLGSDALCSVCEQFPRYSEYYGNVKETGLGLACEEAARIIILDREPFHLELLEESGEMPIAGGEYDDKLGGPLFLLRGKFLELVHKSGTGLFKKLQAMLQACYMIQQAVNKNDYGAAAELCETFSFDGAYDCVRQSLDQARTEKSGAFPLNERMRAVAEVFLSLETLNVSFPETVQHVISRLHEGQPDSAYRSWSAEFLKMTGSRICEYENLINYYIYRYFMKAAYDHDVVGKMQLVTAGLLMVHDMEIARWLDFKHNFTVQDRLDIVHVFSREVEYSEDNIMALAEEFIFNDAFDVITLLSLLEELSSGD